MLVRYNSVFVPLCSPNTCKDVFNPNVTAFQSNCAEGLHFVLFITIAGSVVLTLEHYTPQMSGLLLFNISTSKAAHTRFNLVAFNRYLPLSCIVYGSKLLSCSLTAKVVSELPQCLFRATSCVKDQRHRSFVTSHWLNSLIFYYRCHVRPRVRPRVRDHGASCAEGSTRVHKHLFHRLLCLLFIWRAMIRVQVAAVSAIPSSIRVQSVILGK